MTKIFLRPCCVDRKMSRKNGRMQHASTPSRVLAELGIEAESYIEPVPYLGPPLGGAFTTYGSIGPQPARTAYAPAMRIETPPLRPTQSMGMMIPTHIKPIMGHPTSVLPKTQSLERMNGGPRPRASLTPTILPLPVHTPQRLREQRQAKIVADGVQRQLTYAGTDMTTIPEKRRGRQSGEDSEDVYRRMVQESMVVGTSQWRLVTADNGEEY